MNRFFTLIFCTFFFISNAQTGYQIRMKNEKINADSLFVKAYHVKSKKFTKIISLKFEKDITLKDKTPLLPGIYIIEADSILLTEFLISDDKNQKFTISFLEDDLKFDGSKENTANRAYMKQMMEYRQQVQALNQEFQMMQQKGMPNSMMQAYVDNYLKKLDSIHLKKMAYQEKVMAENKGSLLASIIQISLEIPPPPETYYRDRTKLFSYLAEHQFDNFTWTDERLLNTPVLYDKFREFCQQILQLDTEIAIPIVLKSLNESKKNAKLYLAFFDNIEHEFGNYKSPYRNVDLYMPMLKDILNMPDIEETRKLYYEFELNLINKNQPGAQAIDFNILLSNGDTTTMYAIDAEILILYFQNPDCPTCGEFREKLKNMEVLYNAIASGKVKVLTVYFDENETLWRNYLEKRAFSNWLHAWNYDHKISENALYDYRIIPMIMILDKNKKVLQKDIFPNELEEWLKKN